VFSAIVPRKLVLMAPTVASMVEAGTMLEVELRASMTAAMVVVLWLVYYWGILFPAEYDCSFFLPSNSAPPKLFFFCTHTLTASEWRGQRNVPMNSPAGVGVTVVAVESVESLNKEIRSHATRDRSGKKNDQSVRPGTI